MRIHRAMKERDMGFTLIELLVVIIIIGILASIAIPVFFSQRKKAVDSSVRSDVTNASLTLESYYATNNKYPAAAPTGTDQIVVTAGNKMNVTIASDGSGYCVFGYATGGSNYTSAAPKIYDSLKGGLQSDTSTCSISGGSTWNVN
jgi:prepilin-type N-terminal cleavage/methylation domain-containing protein